MKLMCLWVWTRLWFDGARFVSLQILINFHKAPNVKFDLAEIIVPKTWSYDFLSIFVKNINASVWNTKIQII